jgi:hypothetical protein
VPIDLTLSLPDTTADRLLVLYSTGAVIKLQRDTTSAFPAPTDVTSVPIISGTESYLYADANGTVASWYRTRYENAGGTVTSAWSTGFQPGVVGLCSLQDVKDRLGITDTTSDELLSDLIDEVTNVIQNETGRTFVPTTSTTLLLDGKDALDLRTFLVEPGILTLTKVETATQTGGTFSEVTLSTVTTISRGANSTILILPLGSFFWWGYQNVRLTGTFGYATVPEAVQGVAMRAVIRLFQARGSGVAVASGGEGFGSMLLQNISPEDRRVLAHYAMPLVG